MNGEFAIGIHALACLSCKGGTVSSEELAECICTNPARVRKVMGRLGRAGLVEAKGGSVGGYRMAGAPEAVTLLRVLEALDMTVVTPTWKSGSLDAECMKSSGMAAVLGEICRRLDADCRAYLATVTIADIMREMKDRRERP